MLVSIILLYLKTLHHIPKAKQFFIYGVLPETHVPIANKDGIVPFPENSDLDDEDTADPVQSYGVIAIILVHDNV